MFYELKNGKSCWNLTSNKSRLFEKLSVLLLIYSPRKRFLFEIAEYTFLSGTYVP